MKAQNIWLCPRIWICSKKIGTSAQFLDHGVVFRAVEKGAAIQSPHEELKRTDGNFGITVPLEIVAPFADKRITRPSAYPAKT